MAPQGQRMTSDLCHPRGNNKTVSGACSSKVSGEGKSLPGRDPRESRNVAEAAGSQKHRAQCPQRTRARAGLGGEGGFPHTVGCSGRDSCPFRGARALPQGDKSLCPY